MKSSYFLFFVVFVVFIVLVSCDKQDPLPENRDLGTITGQDFTLCACCGGWFIQIDGEQYRFMEIPPSTDIDLNGDFPIDVLIDWNPQQNACLGDEIDVISMQLAN